jgi:hypothetical protein
MTTSGVFTNIDTVQQVIIDALIELQIYSANQQLKPADGELGRRRLNWMLKQWQDDGVNLWRQAEITITWPAATAVANLEDLAAPITGVNDILGLRHVVTASYERELERWELDDYNSMPNKAAVGGPSVYTVTRELLKTRVRLWPVSSTALTLKATTDRRVEDVTLLTETLDVPQQHTRTVMMNLAAVLAPAFGKANDPNALVTIREAARLYQLMRANDRPASYFMRAAGGR